MYPIRIGVVANEFFCTEIGRMGGFGWAARQVARLARNYPEYALEVTFLSGKPSSNKSAGASLPDGTRLIWRDSGPAYTERLRQLKLSVLLTIDYRPEYFQVLEALPEIPAIFWLRDPRPQEVLARIRTLQIPGANGALQPKGIRVIDCSSLSRLVKSRPPSSLAFAAPAHSVSPLAEKAFNLDNISCVFLPNIVDMVKTAEKSSSPSVVFLGRLDPIKRPWMFLDLAREFPAVDFFLLGQAHFRGEGSWSPARLPPNAKLLGHLDGDRKQHILSSAWVLVNTSIHESLATSFLEALACETPLLSSTNFDGVVARFGVFTGPGRNNGRSEMPAFANGLHRLLNDRSKRLMLGRNGRLWVEQTHHRERFAAVFRSICEQLGIAAAERREMRPCR